VSAHLHPVCIALRGEQVVAARVTASSGGLDELGELVHVSFGEYGPAGILGPRAEVTALVAALADALELLSSAPVGEQVIVRQPVSTPVDE
jgi:hypothetical protein